MCGRYVNVASSADLSGEFDAEQAEDAELAPSWNVAPTDPVAIVIQRRRRGDDRPAAAAEADPGSGAGAGEGAAAAPAARRELRTARWGLVPSWSSDRRGAARLINARIETVTSKRAFSVAAARRRCLVPALGYYEWQRTEQGKVAHFLHHPEGRLLALAGLYELWRDPERADDDSQRWFWSCTIITQQASDLLGEIHDRSPVPVPEQLWSRWLDCSTGQIEVAAELLAQLPSAQLASYVVAPKVGNVRNNGPELIEPITDHRSAEPGRADLDPDQLSFLL